MSESSGLPPEQEAVRRLLADARHDGPTPPDVVARLDETLASLTAERASSAPPPRGRARRPLAGPRRRPRLPPTPAWRASACSPPPPSSSPAVGDRPGPPPRRQRRQRVECRRQSDASLAESSEDGGGASADSSTGGPARRQRRRRRRARAGVAEELSASPLRRPAELSPTDADLDDQLARAAAGARRPAPAARRRSTRSGLRRPRRPGSGRRAGRRVRSTASRAWSCSVAAVGEAPGRRPLRLRRRPMPVRTHHAARALSGAGGGGNNARLRSVEDDVPQPSRPSTPAGVTDHT